MKGTEVNNESVQLISCCLLTPARSQRSTDETEDTADPCGEGQAGSVPAVGGVVPGREA